MSKIFLIHLPRPSARTKYFLSWTNLKLSRTKFLSRVKNSIFSFKINSKWNFLIGRVSKNHFHLQMLILNNFGNQKMDFLTLDKIFVLDNLNIVLDKKYFVRADGRGKSLVWHNMKSAPYTLHFLWKFYFSFLKWCFPK